MKNFLTLAWPFDTTLSRGQARRIRSVSLARQHTAYGQTTTYTIGVAFGGLHPHIIYAHMPDGRYSQMEKTRLEIVQQLEDFLNEN